MRTTILVGLLVLFLFDINAQHNITDSLEKAISTSSPDELQQIYFQLSEEFKKTDLIKAKFYSQKAISASEDDNKMLGLAYFSMATIYGIQHKQDTVIFYMKKALNCFDATNDSTLDASIPDMIFSSLSYFDNQFKIESLNKFAQRYFYNKPYLSRIICSKSLEFALDENKPDLLADTYKMLGFINKTLGNLNKALEYDNEAYKLYIELNDSLNIGFTLNLIAVVRNMKGENDIALSRFMDAEKYLLALYKNDTHNKSVINRLSILYTNIGLLYSFQLMNYKEAEKYFNKVIDYAEQTNDTVRINASLANLGHVYLETKDYKKALNYFKQALDIATHTKNFYFAARITHNIGKLYEKQEEFENSREYYRIALDMMKRLNDQFGICRTNRIIGESYLKQKKAKPALDHFYPALNFAVKSNSEDEIKMIYFDLSKIYEIDSNIDSAYHYFKLYTDVNNEINNEQSRKRFEELQVKYESEKKEKENKFLREETQIQERLKYYLFFIISALLILSVLLIYFFRLKSKLLKQERSLKEVLLNKKEIEEKRLQESIFAEKQINRLQQEKLKHKNRELSTATLQIINKNNILSDISEMLNRTNSNNEEKLKQEICKVIKDNIDSDNDWQQFKLHFEEVHIGFFDNLKTNYPGLTQNELKLCAYLRINLSSKEIAQMLHNTSDTINKSRYRLRKKLNLSNEDDLIEFIRNV